MTIQLQNKGIALHIFKSCNLVYLWSHKSFGDVELRTVNNTFLSLRCRHVEWNNLWEKYASIIHVVCLYMWFEQKVSRISHFLRKYVFNPQSLTHLLRIRPLLILYAHTNEVSSLRNTVECLFRYCLELDLKFRFLVMYCWKIVSFKCPFEFGKSREGAGLENSVNATSTSCFSKNY